MTERYRPQAITKRDSWGVWDICRQSWASATRYGAREAAQRAVENEKTVA